MAGLPSLQPSKGLSGNQALAFCFFSSNCLIEVVREHQNWSRAVGGGGAWKTLLLHSLLHRRTACPGMPSTVMSRVGSQTPTARYVSLCKKPETLSPLKLALTETATAFQDILCKYTINVRDTLQSLKFFERDMKHHDL